MDTLIAEDLLLLLLDDAKGTARASTYLSTALGGAVLVDLALREAVEIDEKERSAQDLVTRLGKG